MPRPIWSGAISFGLVTVPVKLYPAISQKDVSFHQIDKSSRGSKSRVTAGRRTAAAAGNGRRRRKSA